MLVLQAWRAWQGSRGVALLAAVALAVGIGSTTAIYSVVNAVMLKPLPYPDGGRFVALFGGSDTDPSTFRRCHRTMRGRTRRPRRPSTRSDGFASPTRI